jgi:hypothetical protein
MFERLELAGHLASRMPQIVDAFVSVLHDPVDASFECVAAVRVCVASS